VGHHDDLAAGLGILHDRAELVNSMPDVTWEDMQTIAESNYWTRQCGETLCVTMYSRTVKLRIPTGVTHVLVDRPWLDANDTEPLAVSGQGLAQAIHESHYAESISVVAGTTVTLRALCKKAINPDSFRLPRTTPQAIARRNLCELRDRLRPTVDRILRRELRS
jgi:hypothetical protein